MNEDPKPKPKKKDELTAKDILGDFKNAWEYFKKWRDHAMEDVEFALGKQWEDSDLAQLEEAKVRGLTINKIRPTIFLLTGIESQNRTDFVAFPTGDEDSVPAEISTDLIKDAMKNSDGNYKFSETYESGLMAGAAFLEPYLDYTDNLLYGKLKWKVNKFDKVFPDPRSEEYDLSDARFVCKLLVDLELNQLKELFPNRIKELDKIDEQMGKLNIDGIGLEKDQTGTDIQRKGYTDNKDELVPGTVVKPKYDLLEYQYKNYVPKYYVADKELGTITEYETEEAANNFVKGATEKEVEAGVEPTAKVLIRMIPEIWMAYIIGNTGEIFENERAWSYPRWKSWTQIPFYVYRSNDPVKKENRHLLIQGIVRGLKDPQRELNKRKTQELRILNTSANSGWLAVKGAWVDPKKVEDFGATPGVNLEWDWDKAHGIMPQKITPTQLSQGHSQLAQENANDMKEISGINTDLLAMAEGGQDSGRAIALRQKQGMVMVQKVFDNLSRTKRIVGRFILSQLGEIYDAKTAIKVLGDAFIQQNFQAPVMMQGPGGQQIPALDPKTGQPQMQLDKQKVALTFDQVLKDAQMGEHDVEIGEGANNETVKFGNFQMLMEMAKTLPIPPDILIDESLLSTASKERIKAAIEQAQLAAQNAPKKAAA